MSGPKLGSNPVPYPLSTWERALAGFDTAPFCLVSRRALLKRVDTKFLLPEDTALSLLAALRAEYAVLPAGNALAARYDTRYFDSPQLRFFHEHRRGLRLRHKVRIRQYLDRQAGFLEVKKKVSPIQQIKFRREREYGDTIFSISDNEFVQGHIHSLNCTLLPQVSTHFFRITLIHKTVNERVTLDFDLTVSAYIQSKSIPSTVILETKQWPSSRLTPARIALRELKIRPRSFSKYCAAILLFYPGIRGNRLMPDLRAVVKKRK